MRLDRSSSGSGKCCARELRLHIALYSMVAESHCEPDRLIKGVVHGRISQTRRTKKKKRNEAHCFLPSFLPAEAKCQAIVVVVVMPHACTQCERNVSESVTHDNFILCNCIADTVHRFRNVLVGAHWNFDSVFCVFAACRRIASLPGAFYDFCICSEIILEKCRRKMY